MRVRRGLVLLVSCWFLLQIVGSVRAQDAAPQDRNAVNTRAQAGGLAADSPVVFPKEGPLPPRYPPDLTETSDPAEPAYYLFSSPCRSLAQIRAIQQDMPKGAFTVPSADWTYLRRTRQRLVEGGDLRVLALGDSIVNDTMRSGWVALLQEAYPKARVHATVYVRGGGGCQHYKDESRVAKHIVPRKPDLVLIGGISQKDIDSIREVIRQLREGLPEVEILLTTGAFGTVDPRDSSALAKAPHSGSGAYGKALRALAMEQRCAYLDVTTPWAEYLRSAQVHPHRFYRDVVHANEYGEQVLAKILMAFWTAPEPPESLAAGPARPNVLVVLTDDQGLGDTSAFGTRDLRTPHLDRLFREGMTFRNFYANSCVCSPTRAALLTGCYPDRVGVPGVIRGEVPADSWGHLAPGVTLLPEVLGRAGYHTALIGKWHLGVHSPNTPTERGFRFFKGFLGDMMDDYWTHRRHGHNFMRHNLAEIDPPGHATDLFTDWACDYLTERARTGGNFFLYLAYNAPHDPIQPPPEVLAEVKRREPEMLEKRARLVALIEHLDAGVGRVLDTLDRTGLATNTLVVFTSDNGGALGHGAENGPWRSGKGHLYEGGLRVPAAARWPGVVQAGAISDRVTLTMDLFATVCDAAGVAVPTGIDGVSFLSALRGEPESELGRDLYFVRREGGTAYGGKTIEALRRGDWKLVQDSPFGPPELYHLGRDPRESRDLAKTNPRMLNELSAALRLHVQRGGQVAWQTLDR